MIKLQSKLLLLFFVAGFLCCGGCVFFKKDLPQKNIPSFFEAEGKEKGSVSDFVTSFGVKKSPEKPPKEVAENEEEKSWYSDFTALFETKRDSEDSRKEKEEREVKSKKEDESWYSGFTSLFETKKKPKSSVKEKEEEEEEAFQDDQFQFEETEKVVKDSEKKEPDKGSTFLLSDEAKEIYAHTER